MLLEFDADQRLWQETVRDAVTKQCPATLVREVAEQGVDPAPLWQSYIDQGWTELTDSENAVELAIVLEELGRATDLTPYLATMSQYAPLAGDRFDPAKAGAAVYSGVTANRDASGWVLTGTAHHVLDGDRAQNLAVVTDAGVFLVDAAEAVVHRSPIFDPVMHVAEVSFDNVHVDDTDRVTAHARSEKVTAHARSEKVTAHARSEKAPVGTEKARHLALTGMAVTMVGACQRVLDLALEHVKQRQQFGVAIGSFQAVQHKAVDMHVAIERARALAYFAALTIAADDPRRRLASAMAKAAAGECQAVVFRHGLQLFGAMGFTWENDVQFALKRAKAGELLLGGAAEHRALIAAEYRTTYRGL